MSELKHKQGKPDSQSYTHTDTYTFTFRGEIDPKTNNDQVTTKLAALFKCDQAALAPIFSGEAVFERSNIDKLTAHAYAEQFKKLGALGFISQSPANNPQQNTVQQNTEQQSGIAHSNVNGQILQTPPTNIDEVTHCPKCSSSKLENGQCQSCGVFLHKVLSTIAPQTSPSKTTETFNTQSHPYTNTPVQQIFSSAKEKIDAKDNYSSPSSPNNETDNSETDIEALIQRQKDKEALKANSKSQRWLTYSSIAIIAIIMGDQALQNFYTLEQAGVDIGILPLLIAHACLLRGCFLFAKEQDLEMHYGFLGLLSIAGLALLSLIATRHQGNPIRLKQLAFVVFSFVVVYHWSDSLGLSSNVYQQQLMDSQHLSEGRQEYPSTTLQNEPELYSKEEREILDYLNATLDTLDTKKMRPNQVERVADFMFSEFARYQAWRNYQYFLHASQGEDLPKTFGEDQVKQHHQKFKILFNARINRLSSHPRLVRTYESWAASAIPDTIPRSALGITRKIHNTFDIFRFSAEDKTPFDTDIKTMNDVDLTPYLPTTSEGVSVTSEGNIITIHFDDPQLKQTPLSIAFYWEKVKENRRYTPRNSNASNFMYKANIAMITPKFPYKYISGGYLQILEEYELLHQQ